MSPGGRPPSKIDGLLIAALMLSLWMHGAVLGVIALANWLESLETPEEPPPVMEIVDIAEFPALSEQVRALADIPDEAETANPDGQIVQLAKPDSPEVAPDDARFRAEFDRRAEEETAARDTALTPPVLADEFRGLGTEAGAGTERFEGDSPRELAMLGRRAGEAGEAGDEPFEGRSIEDVLQKDEFGILAKEPEPRRYAGAPGRPGGSIDEAGTGGELAMAGAPNNDYLPGIRPGERTALNAKRDFFASFFIRVEKQVEPYWVKAVRGANPRPGELQRRDYLTVANIVLAPDGSLIAVDLTKSCGYGPWDQAVLAAFQQAAPFMNPPKGLIEADGKIHLDDWKFVVSLTGDRQFVHMYGDPRAGKLFPGVNEGAIGPR